MTGALRAKRGERDISRGPRHKREARDEGKRKIKRLFAVHFLFPSSRAPREISRSPRLAHKAPVMQAKMFSQRKSTRYSRHECRSNVKFNVFSSKNLHIPCTTEPKSNFDVV